MQDLKSKILELRELPNLNNGQRLKLDSVLLFIEASQVAVSAINKNRFDLLADEIDKFAERINYLRLKHNAKEFPAGGFHSK